MPYPQFDRSQLRLLPLAERTHDVHIADLASPDTWPEPFQHPGLDALAQAIRSAREVGAAVILMMGAHVIKNGLSRYIIDLMERGWLSLIALNGAGMIHDYEMATIGATSESVARYIRTGQFGLWRETGQLNEIAKSADAQGIGLGEAVGAELLASQAPHRDASILAAGCRLGMPVTVHVSLGYDIIHEHPNADGAAIGAGSYRDFLVYAQMITRLEHGVMIAAGTAVMGPEVYLKALSMARNVLYQEGRSLRHFTTANFDLIDLGDYRRKLGYGDPQYYYRPRKNIVNRPVSRGGMGWHFTGDHQDTIPALYNLLTKG